MEIAETYEIKFHNYDGNEREMVQFLDQYSMIRESKRNEGNVNAKVLSYFFDGLIALTNADESFWAGNNQGAYTSYQESLRMFNRFKNSRNSDARLDRLSTRMIHRTTGLLNLTDAIIIKDNVTKEDLFSQALGNFNEEVSLANIMNEQMSSYAAFARASFTEIKSIVETVLRGLDLDATFEEYDNPSFIQGRCAKIMVDGEEIGKFGELHPKVIRAFELRNPINVLEMTLEKVK